MEKASPDHASMPADCRVAFTSLSMPSSPADHLHEVNWSGLALFLLVEVHVLRRAVEGRSCGSEVGGDRARGDEVSS